jgi:hypothetical protein
MAACSRALKPARTLQFPAAHTMRRVVFVVSALLLIAIGLPAAPARAQDGSSETTSGPTVVIIGHDPDRPSTQQAAPVVYVVPVFVPFFAPGPGSNSRPPACETPHEKPLEVAAPAGRFGRFMADPTRRFLNDGWITPAGDPAARSTQR